MTVFARGLLHHLFTRVYFPNHVEANAADPLLAALDEERRATLMAVPDGGVTGPGYRFDVRMQGPGETVFLDLSAHGLAQPPAETVETPETL